MKRARKIKPNKKRPNVIKLLENIEEADLTITPTKLHKSVAIMIYK